LTFAYRIKYAFFNPTRQNGRTAVLLSLDDFRSYEETAYLMKSPKNAERLNAAIADLEAGKGIDRELIKG